MHESPHRGKLMLGEIPMPEEALARLLGLDKQNLTLALSTLLTYGVASKEPSTGALICRRMVRDEILRKVRANAGKQGGNPILLKQKSTTRVKQKPTPSSSVSSSSSEDIAAAPRARNLFIDALATFEGIPLGEIGKSGARLGKALADIKAASPDVTPAEIDRRGLNLKVNMPDLTHSAVSLAKWWGPSNCIANGHEIEKPRKFGF